MIARLFLTLVTAALSLALAAGPAWAQEKKDEAPAAPKNADDKQPADEKKPEEKKPDDAKPVEFKVNDVVEVVAETANLQRGKDIVAEVKKGQELKILKIQGVWLGTSAPNNDGKVVGGWIHKKHVKLKVAAAEASTSEKTPEKKSEKPNPEKPEKSGNGAVEAPDPSSK